MEYISKIDYSVGVFVSTILKSSQTVPSLFEATDKSKIVRFETDLGKFNVYVKYSYSAKFDKIRYQGHLVSGTYADVPFTEKDMEILNRNFKSNGFSNYIALICTDKSLHKTRICMCPIENALKALHYSSDGGGRKIAISHKNNEHCFNYYGIRGKANPNYCWSSYINHMRYFSKEVADKFSSKV